MLRELQRRCATAIRTGALTPELQALIADGDFSPGERLSVYRNNHRLTLTAALAGAYPVLAQALGQTHFDTLAARYVAAHRSRSGDLHDYGNGLAAFLATLPLVATRPWLPDLARLEWAVHTIWFAADATPLDPTRLAAVEPADHLRLCFVPHPARHLLATEQPVLARWEAGRDGDATVPAGAGPEWLLIARAGTTIAIAPLDAGTWALASALAAGATLCEACADALATATEPATDAPFALGPALGRLLALGLFSDFHL